MPTHRSLLLWTSLLASGLCAEPNLIQAARNGNSREISAALKAGINANIRDDFGATPLMYAAAFGSLADMQTLLTAGADPNAVTKLGSSALMWATADGSKVRLLLKSGAVVNAKAASGMTPLLSAAVRENIESMRLLLAAGADRDAQMSLLPNAPIRVGLRHLAYFTNEPALRSLIDELGTERPTAQSLVALPGSQPFSGLFITTSFSMRKRTAPGIAAGVEAMLNVGADPNAEIRQLTRALSPLALAASFSDDKAVRLLLDKKADPNYTGTRGITPLMVAVATEDPNLDSVRHLVEAGAQINARDKSGRSVLDWALLQGESPLTAWLRKNGAAPGESGANNLETLLEPRSPRASVELALQRLISSGQNFNQQTACISCHHQSLPAVAIKAAASHGITVPPGAASSITESTLKMWAPSRENLLSGNCSIFGFLGNVSYGLFGLAEQGVAPNPSTDAAVSCLSSLQWPDGRWEGGDMRPPLAGRTPLLYTALAVRAIATYSPEGRKSEAAAQIQRGREFLLREKPTDTQGESFRLLGLIWSKAPATAISEQARRLADLQQKDGGWPQRASMPSDAYATGQAMYALHLSRVAISPKTLQLGIGYLLRTQRQDGTWFVQSRTLGFQPPVESGFPHGPGQFISAAATAWATIALGSLL